jgi:hypothetical protein
VVGDVHRPPTNAGIPWQTKKSPEAAPLACACCRLIWDRIPLAWHRAIEVNEEFADGAVAKEALIAAKETAGRTPISRDEVDTLDTESAWYACDINPTSTFSLVTALRAAQVRPNVEPKTTITFAIFSQQSDVIRDIFQPFRRKTRGRPGEVWKRGVVLPLAQSLYTDRAFDRLPILADALEEAGCTDADILGHLRSPGPHVLGCWALDLLLEKE